MGKKEQDIFFDELFEHSKAKLSLLQNYVIKWMRKVTLGTPQKRCAVIDTFAGTGFYDDGSEGSPIILIKEALNYFEQSQKNPKIDFNKVILIFVEKDIENFSKLKNNIENFIHQELLVDEFNKINTHPKIEILITNDDFNNFTDNLLKNVSSIIPTLMFIDPFGYKVLSYKNISDIIQQYDYCELIINFMYEEINRFFLKSDSLAFISTLKDFYGPNFEKVKEKIKNLNSSDVRRQTIINGYKENLKNAGALYSLDFDIEKNGRYKMNMIFTTKNIYGFDTMKESMLDICNNTNFEYHTSSPQLSLFDIKNTQEMIDSLSIYIFDSFKAKTVMFNSIKKYSMLHPCIPSTYVKKSLKKLEEKGKIVNVEKLDHSVRRKGTFPDNSIILFSGE